jgi:CRP-like cAMP-binding protein
VAAGESQARSRALSQALLQVLPLRAQPLVAVPAGTTLLKAGDPVMRLPFLVEGRVDAVLHLQGDRGAQVVPITFGPGEVVLLSQLFCDRPSAVDLVASEPARLHWVAVPEIEGVLRDDARLLLLLVEFLGERLREVQSRERAWAERGVHERVCAALARMLAEQPVPPDGQRLVVAATHEQLAARCGVSRPKASLALKRLEQAGRVRLGRGTIEVIDLDAVLAASR